MTHAFPENRIETDVDPGVRLGAHNGVGAGMGVGRLRLRKLVLHGFKSFADKVEFVFDRPVVGVVGPNGCGKSNVVDGIKWVLGEQSAKSLRGGAMLDVIFNGAAGRPAGSFAEVTLVFDNPRHGDGERRLKVDSDEVAVGRQLLRDGTSHYKLNGKNARLKDVRDLFLDTGIGVDAYSVIEQGRVAQMLDASGNERRTIFEEAAGISRFKVQKKEAQRKLERVDQNLLRLGDVFEEVERRLRSVKLAAGKARVFQELTHRLADLRLRSAVHDFHALTTNRTGQEQSRQSAQFEADDAADELRHSEAKLADLRREIERADEIKRQSEYARVQAEARIEQAEQRAAYATQQASQIDEQESRLQSDRDEAKQQQAENAQLVAEDERHLAAATIELERASGEIESRHAAHRDAQLKHAGSTESLERAKAATLRAMNQAAGADRRLGGIEIELKTAAERREALGRRRAQLHDEIAAAESVRDELQTRAADLLAKRQSQQTDLDARRNEAAAVGERLSGLGEQLVEARERRSGLASRRKVLTDLEARREGVGEGVQQVLRERDGRFAFIRGLVADVLRVDVEHAAVVEAALDGRDQWLLAESAESAIEHRAAFAALPGRVNVLLPIESAPPPPFAVPADVVARRASDLIRCDEDDRALAVRLLGNTLVVADLETAARLTGGRGIRCVTLDGEVLEADGTLRAGPAGAAMGLISRRSELASVARQVDEADAEITAFQEQLSRGSLESKQIDRDLNAARELLYATNARQVETAEKLSAQQDRLAALRREIPSVEQESGELAEHERILTGEQQQQETARTEARREQQRHESEQERLAADLPSLAQAIAVAAEALTATRIALGQAQEQQIAARRAVERHASRRRELQQQIERINAAMTSLDERRAEAAREADEAARQAKRFESEREALAARVVELAERLTSLKAGAADHADAVDAVRERRDEAENRVRAADTALAELNVRIESLIARAADEAELDVPAAYEMACGNEGYTAPDEDWEAVAREVKDLRGRIGRLGSVNVEAIAELEELEARRERLDSQLTDLRTSKQQLEELIDSLNRESGERFNQTFEAVREHFGAMFRKLFGGGRADLFLQTEVQEKRRDEEGNVSVITRHVDPLEAGIEIVARPPGKQPVSISQLSGGEKTMTCVALLMSIFKSKPSPFCVLDEVDAALDEANNLRFNRIIEEFLGESQFIVITHSKRTMQIADVLYGVTMQEQGVSKKVEVRFDQVHHDGRIAG